ncbi:hypothetical protein L3X38_038749 [Prunus dulcis]|uniref:Uncharacterized protein n=1 Tax=Prunus dulcis TaxID=3755 RepID=A0AAD4YRT0_PRUDU|nr:hypothetical protein L3X38_038749 [Prunus dulcis]
MAEDNHAIGIDLGTTYSCVATWQADHVEILVNDHGNRTTRSYVTFTDSKRLVGDEAFNQAGRFPTNSIFDGSSELFMNVVIPRNSRIPVGMTTSVTTRYDYQESARFAIYEGENRIAKDNNFLGEFTLHGIPPAPRHVPKFNVYFDMDANGVLSVSAEDMSTGQKKGIKINGDRTKN